VIKSACPLLDLFRKNLEVSAVFGLSIYTATAGNPTVENEYSTRKVCLRVSAEKLKICCYVQVEKNPNSQDVF